ncbi:hypothetical protein [Pannonibacter phragmitetus]|uniref:hypothetical protein n=1 Tax=Pannonibacter phragmitetus TaxID=121719 RepID=UPI003D2F4937
MFRQFKHGGSQKNKSNKAIDAKSHGTGKAANKAKRGHFPLLMLLATLNEACNHNAAKFKSTTWPDVKNQKRMDTATPVAASTRIIEPQNRRFLISKKEAVTPSPAASADWLALSQASSCRSSAQAASAGADCPESLCSGTPDVLRVSPAADCINSLLLTGVTLTE